MSLLRAMLIASAVGSVGYGIGLLIPGLYPIPEVAPEGDAWARYLVPIYLGLGVIGWAASRRPTEMMGIAWAFVLIWGGLVAGHVVNMWLGDEPVGAITLGLLAFDASMGGLFLIGIVVASRTVALSAPHTDVRRHRRSRPPGRPVSWPTVNDALSGQWPVDRKVSIRRA